MGYWCVIAALGWIAFTIYANLYRARNRVSVPLRENCLLTRFPFLFVAGKKSIFYFMNYWNSLPECLAQHGYEVYHLDLPWRGRQQRKNELSRFLQKAEKEGQHFHLVIDESSLPEVEDLFSQEFFTSVTSCTLLATTPEQKSSSLVPLKHPIEEVIIPPARSFFHLWRWHRAWVQEPRMQLHPPGVISPRNFYLMIEKILNHAILLAERDFSLNSQQGKKNHVHSAYGSL